MIKKVLLFTLICLSLFVKPGYCSSGWQGDKLTELNDVDKSTTPADGQGIAWNDTFKYWEFIDLGSGSGAPTDADYLVGTTNGSLSAEIVVGTTPGGSLGGTWSSPTIDNLTFEDENTYLGISAGSSSTVNADYNTAVGYQALLTNSVGSYNCAYGASSLAVSTGDYNCAYGVSTLLVNTTGESNCAFGTSTLASNTDADGNSAFGTNSLNNITTGDYNSALGIDAGTYITDGSTANATGTLGVFLGSYTKASANGALNEIVIGYNAIGSGSNTVTLGSTSITSTILRGGIIIGNGATSAGTIQINEDTNDGTNNATFTIPALTADTDYILPPDDGDNGEMLTTDGSGTLTWTAPVGSGDITAVGDVNDGAAFNGTAGTILTFNNIGGDATLDYDGTDFSFSHGISTISLQVDNLNLDGNTISTTAGVDLLITPLAGQQLILDGHFQIDANEIIGLTDNDTVITAYAGKDVVIESVTFDGGVVGGATIGTANTVTINASDITDKHAGTDITADLEEEVTEGSLADSSIVSADIKDATIAGGDLASNIAITTTGLTTLNGNLQLGETEIKLDATLSGDETWSGITTSGVLGDTIAKGDLCYLNNDDGRWELADANLSDGYDKVLGICLDDGADGDTTTMLLYGKVRSAAFPALTVGKPSYISETAGDITETAPTTTDAATRIIGFSLTAEDLLFCPENSYYTHT